MFEAHSLSMKEFSDIFNKYIRDCGSTLIENLMDRAKGHGNLKHENKTLEEIKNSTTNAKTNATFILSHNNLNTLIAECLLVNKTAIYEWVKNPKSQQLFNLEVDFYVGAGYFPNNNALYVSNTLSVVLKQTPHTVPGFSLVTFYPNISKDRQKLTKDILMIEVKSLVDKCEVNPDDISTALGFSDLEFKNNECILVDINTFMEYFKEVDSIDYKLSTKQLTNKQLEETIRNVSKHSPSVGSYLR